jgi:hypothetical protein
MGTCVTLRVMTEVDFGIGIDVGTIVVGVGVGIAVGISVVGIVVGKVGGAVVRRVSGRLVVVVLGRGVPEGDCGSDRASPRSVSADDDDPLNGATCGRRRKAVMPRTTIAAMINTQTETPTGPIPPTLPGEAGFSGIVAPQIVQNFWTENSSAAPHFGQNRRVIIV